MNTFSKMVSIWITAVILFLFPVEQMMAVQDMVLQTYILSETVSFVDQIKKKGYLTMAMYERFRDVLNRTGKILEIDIEHERLLIEPIYQDGEIDGVGEYFVSYKNTEIMESIYGNSGIYQFRVGDGITITVKERKTKRFSQGIELYAVYGGMIQNES